jgi:hypothetical protein
MPRAYTIATAALALETSVKWLDNTLSHNRVAGVVQRKQGVARRITVDGLLALSIVLILTAELGSTVAIAIEISQKLIAAGGEFESSSGFRITMDLERFRNRLISRLETAVEAAPLPRRGRPPKSTTGRLE